MANERSAAFTGVISVLLPCRIWHEVSYKCVSIQMHVARRFRRRQDIPKPCITNMSPPGPNWISSGIKSRPEAASSTLGLTHEASVKLTIHSERNPPCHKCNENRRKLQRRAAVIPGPRSGTRNDGSMTSSGVVRDAPRLPPLPLLTSPQLAGGTGVHNRHPGKRGAGRVGHAAHLRSTVSASCARRHVQTSGRRWAGRGQSRKRRRRMGARHTVYLRRRRRHAPLSAMARCESKAWR